MSATDNGLGAAISPDAPASDGYTITTSDSLDLPALPRGIYVGTGGNLYCDFGGRTNVPFKNVPSGSVLPIRPSRVRATNTTAADLVALL